MEDPHGSRPQAGAAARGEEPMQEEQVTWQELLPMGDPGWSSFLLMDGTHGMDHGAVLEELLLVGSPCRISLRRMASRGRDPMLEQGKRVTEKEWQRQSAID